MSQSPKEAKMKDAIFQIKCCEEVLGSGSPYPTLRETQEYLSMMGRSMVTALELICGYEPEAVTQQGGLES